MSQYDEHQFSELLGRTLVQITGKAGDEEVHLLCSDGSRYLLNHHQDCCEYVSLEDVVGDLADLIGEPLLEAEEVEGSRPADYEVEYEPDSETWTFYKLTTRKGSVTLRWCGTSNGYYSESVNFEKLT